jgi:urea transport system substrate-binding protein
VPFYKELGNQGLKATDVPVVAFSVGEETAASTPIRWSGARGVELLHVAEESSNDAFRSSGLHTRRRSCPAPTMLTNDPMEAAYVGIHMWAQAVTSQDDRRRQSDCGGERPDILGAGRLHDQDGREEPPSMEPVFIDEVQKDGQFNVVWKPRGRFARNLEPVHRRQRQEEDGESSGAAGEEPA